MPAEIATVTVQIRSASGVRTSEAHLTADPLTATVTVLRPPTVSIAEVPALDEGQQQEITVTTSEALDYDVTVELAVGPTSTAIAGRDYATLPMSVTIPAGATSVTFTLEALNDDLYEQQDEIIALALSLDGHPDLNRGAIIAIDVVIRNTNPPPTVSIVGVEPVDEGSTGRFHIVLDGKLDVALAISVSVGLASTAEPEDYRLPVTKFMIEAEQLTATAMLELIALEDTIMPPELDEFVVLELVKPTDSMVMVAVPTTVTIRNVEIIPPVVSITAVDPIDEGDSAQIEITLDRDTNDDVILNLEVKVESSTAILNADYKPLTSTVTISAGQTVTTILLETIPDEIYERDEQITLALTISSGIATLGTGAERVIIITDDETQPILSLDPILPIMEGDQTQIIARLDGILDVPLTLNLVTAAISSAGYTSDYTLSATSFEIPAGDRTATITLTIIDDDIYEGDETLVLGLNTASDLPALGTITRTVMIVESEDRPTISFDPNIPAETINEGSLARVRVILTGVPSAVDETVTVQVLGGTATEGADFNSIDRTVTIPTGADFALISIDTTPADALYEGDKTILLELVSSTGLAQIGQPQRREITIDESLPAPTVSLQTPPATVNETGTIELLATIPEPVAVTITVSIAIDQLRSTAAEGVDFAFVSESARIEIGDETATFVLNITPDTIYEDTETIVLRLTGATAGVNHDTTEFTLSITDDDSDSLPPISFDPVPDVNEGETATVTIRLDSAVGVDLVVSLAGSSTTLTPDEYALPTSVTILAGDTTATITLTTADDTLEEPLRELLLLQATAVDGVPIVDEAQRPAITIAIIDNEIPDVSVQNLTGVEGQTVTAKFVLTYAHNSDVNLSLEASADYQSDVDPGMLDFTIPQGDTSATVEIYLVPDNSREGDETVEYELISPDTSALGVGETRSLVITVSDQPDIAQVTLSIDPEIVTEGPDVTVVITATLDIVLPTELTVLLTYDPTSSASPDDYAPGPSLEIVIPAGKLISSTVLTIIDDGFFEFPDPEKIKFDVSTNNPLVAVIPTAAVKIQDAQNKPTLSLEKPELSVDEGKSTTLKAILTGALLEEDLTINLRETLKGASAADYRLSTSAITILAGQTSGTVEFEALPDDIYETINNVSPEIPEKIEYEISATSDLRDLVTLGLHRTVLVVIIDVPTEVPTVSFEAVKSITEGDTATATVRLSGPLGYPLELTLAVGASTSAELLTDYQIVPTTLEIAPGDTMAEFEITTRDDDRYEGPEIVELGLLISGAKLQLATDMTRVITIVDDQPLPTVSLLAIADVSEGVTATIIAELTGKLDIPVVLELTATGGSAVELTDYEIASATLEIAPGDLTAQFEIDAPTDGVRDGIKTVELELTVSGGVVNVIDGRQTLTILDADALSPSLTLDAVAPIDEGDTGVVTARLNKVLSTILTITVVTTLASDPTSAADSLDYSLSSNLIEIPAGSLDVTFTLTATPDGIYEGDEQLILNLMPVGDKVDLGTVARTVTIRETDPVPGISLDPIAPLREGTTANLIVRLSGELKFTSTVNLSVVGGTAVTPADYDPLQLSVEIAAGERTATVSLSILDDDLYEGIETLRLRLSGSGNAGVVTLVSSEETIQIADANLPPTVFLVPVVPSVTEADRVTVAVVLSGRAAFPINVSLAHEPTSTADTTDYSLMPSVVIPTGQLTATISFEASEDDLYELTETVRLNLRAFRGGTLLSDTPAMLTIIDNELPPTVSFDPDATAEQLIKNEGESFEISLLLSGATTAIELVVPFDIMGTAEAGTDYTLPPLSVTFVPFSTTAVITLDTIDDDLNEDTETIVLTLRQAGSYATIGTNPTQTLTIRANDVAADPIVIGFRPGTYEVDEDAGGITLTVEVISGVLTEDVVLTYTTADGTATSSEDYTGATNGVPIPTLSAMITSVSFRIPILDDSRVEGAESFTVDLSGTPAGVSFNPTSATVRIIDNDVVIGFRPDTYEVSEGAGKVTLTVEVLAGVLTQDVTLSYATMDDSAVAPGDYTRANSGSIPTLSELVTRVTFRIMIEDDMSAESTERFFVDLDSVSLPAGVTLDPSRSRATVTITDDDMPVPGVELVTPTISPSVTTLNEGESDTNVGD